MRTRTGWEAGLGAAATALLGCTDTKAKAVASAGAGADPCTCRRMRRWRVGGATLLLFTCRRMLFSQVVYALKDAKPCAEMWHLKEEVGGSALSVSEG